LNLLDGYVHGEMSRREFPRSRPEIRRGGITATRSSRCSSPIMPGHPGPPDDKAHQGELRDRALAAGQRLDQGLSRPSGERAKLPSSSSSTRTAASIPISRMWRGRWRLPISSPSRPTAHFGRRLSGRYEKGGALFQAGTKMKEDFFAAATWLKARPDSAASSAPSAFASAAASVNQLAVRQWRGSFRRRAFLRRPSPNARGRQEYKAPIDAQYGDSNTRITGGWASFDEALTRRTCRMRAHLQGANHGFHTTTAPYDEAAAKGGLAAHAGCFNKYLRGEAEFAGRPD